MSLFPIPASELGDLVPHRPPMVWIDEVTQVTENTGDCRVKLRASAHFMDGGQVRPTSMIEWIAQGYAFVRAAQLRAGLLVQKENPKTVFLAAVKDADFEGMAHPTALHHAKELRIHIRCGRSYGPISLVDGQVYTESGHRLASASLKVFSE